MNKKNGKREGGSGKGLKLFTLYSLLFTLHALRFTLPSLDAAPYQTITVDGDMSEWSSAEIIAADGADSDWDPGAGKNEIYNLYAAWDAGNLYIGARGAIDGKGIIIWLDSGRGSGFSDTREINTWNRRASFSGWAPDYFYAAWDGSAGNFYRISSSFTAEDVGATCSMAFAKAGNAPGWEIRVPFDLLYSRGNFVPAGVELKICAALATGDVGTGSFGDYGYLGGDSAPDNVVTGLSDAVLAAYASVAPDGNADGLPDDANAGTVLAVTNASVYPVKFAPAMHGETSVSLDVNKAAGVSAAVYDTSGGLVRTLSEISAAGASRKVFSWDGRRDDGASVPGGVYLINIRVSAATESARMNKAVVVIR